MDYKALFEKINVKIYLVTIAVLITILFFFKPLIGFIGFIVFGALIYDYMKDMTKKESAWIRYIENLSDKFDSTTKHAIFNLPFPLVMMEMDGEMIWYNSKFKEMLLVELPEDEEILHRNLESFIPSFKVENILDSKDKKPLKLNYGGRNYKVYFNMVKDPKNEAVKEKTIVLYWVENTDFVELLEKCKEEELVTCLAYVDNYDEVKNTTPEVLRPQVLAEIDSIINNYTYANKGIARKYENDKYLLLFERKHLKRMEERKFDVLDEIREIDMGNTIPVTLSLGVGLGGENLSESYDFSKASIDITLGRGGDQAVIKNKDNISFYGGKTKAIEKRNKVKSRVISHALRQLMDQADRIFIMGHKGADMDCFGASIGIYRAAVNINKKAYIVLDEVNPSIKNIYNRMSKEEPDYLEAILDEEQAGSMIRPTDLLVVVDNHKPTFTAAPSLLDKTKNIVLIDHHRRGAEFIKNPILVYLEPYASSTCELVTEVLHYMDDKFNMTKFDADALLAGITVDTKNFTFQTGVRTFEAASILKRAGADTTAVSQLFRDDFNTFLYKAEVVSSSKVVFDKIAVGRLEKDMEDSVLIAAQGANELLNINGIEASFVMTLSSGKIHISGRSLGSISVQLILEKLGGGGHLTSAGTQIPDVSIDDAEEMLMKAIKEYLLEGEDD